MIRVLHYLGNIDRGGTQSFVMNLYDAIDRESVQFDFIIYPGQKELPYYKEIILKGGRIFECPKYNGKNHLIFCKWWNVFFQQHIEYHVLHSHIRGSASIFLPIAQKYGVITIVHSHSTSNGNGFTAIVKDIIKFPIRRQADYMFACSDKAGKWLFGEKALKKSNYKMIPNGVNLERFAFDVERRKKMRKQLEIKDDEFVIGHIGRFSEPKNHKFLIKIFADYLEKNPKSKLLLVGDGELYGVIENEIKKMNIENNIILTGSRTNTEDYYQVMDVFVFPSLWEGLPVSVVEAQANGLPCLISDVITHDVNLTDLVKYISLEKERLWIESIEKTEKLIRSKVSDENKKRLNSFDSKIVAQELQNFYINQHKKVER